MEGNVEQPKKPSQELPIGEAEKLNKLVNERWQEHLVLFSQVKNEVLEVNPALEEILPLKLEVGKTSPFGLFAEAAFQKKPTELPSGKQALEVWPIRRESKFLGTSGHGRSAILGRIVFRDNEGRTYRDIDLKGVGLLKQGNLVYQAVEVWTLGEAVPEGGKKGLLDYDIAFADYQMSEDFLRAGIRTHRVLAILGLKELIIGGRKISLEEAVGKEIIDKDFKPVIEIRAFGTKMRIDDAKNVMDGEEKKLILNDAIKLVSQELGREQLLSNEEYLQWFAETLGLNVGLIHKNGWLHNYLTDHNVTLDCRIVDLDSIEILKSLDQTREDLVGAEMTIYSLIKLVVGEYDKDKITRYVNLFRKSYDSTFPPKEREKYFKKLEKVSKKTRSA